MLELKKSKTNAVGGLSLLLVVTLLLPFIRLAPSTAAPVDNGSVYCPLQKKWVEKNKPAPRMAAFNVFDRICAAWDVKTGIVRNVFGKLSPFQIITSEAAAEKLIFDYLDYGDFAVKAFRSSPAPAPNHLIEQKQIAKVLNDWQTFVFSDALSTACLHTNPRPPNKRLNGSNRPEIYNSQKFSLNRSPRPPPSVS